MPEIIIKYTDSKILNVLKSLSGLLDFKISIPKKEGKEGEFIVNGVTMVRGKGKINDDEMKEIFTASNFNAKELRSKWQREK